MKDEINQTFDLPALLKSGDLDIRGTAAIKQSMTVKEYFNLLLKFTSLAPDASAAIVKFAGLDGDEKSFKCLEDITILMTGVGCNNLVTEIDNIISAYNKGDVKLAADCAKEISDDFVGLYTRIIGARKDISQKTAVGTASGDIQSSDNYSEPDELISLIEYLKQLDNEEAARKLRILVIDDSSVVLKIVSSVLSDQYQVFTLAKPKMLEKFLEQVEPELFLLDYKMPELSGFDLVPIIRSFKEHKDTPIMILTSEGTADNLSAAVMLGARDFIVKPVRPEILREKIANNIVRKKSF